MNGGITMMTREDYIAGLVAERRRQGLSQQTVAARAGVRQTAVSRWETGQTNPDPAALAVWAAALGVDPYPDPATHPTCGTDRGYQRHQRRGEDACDRCLNAHAVYQTIYRHTRAVAA